MPGLLDPDGEVVRNAIASALRVINANRIDISEELNKIQNGRYGYDIRMAIYDALYTLADNVPEKKWNSVIGTITIIEEV